MSDKNLVKDKEMLYIALCYFASIVDREKGAAAYSYNFMCELYKEEYNEEFPTDEIEKLTLKEITSGTLYALLDAWEDALDWEVLALENKKAYNVLSACASDIKLAAVSFEEVESTGLPASSENSASISVSEASKLVQDFMNGPWIKTLIVQRYSIQKRVSEAFLAYGIYDKSRNNCSVLLEENKPFYYSPRPNALSQWFATEIQNYAAYLKGQALSKPDSSQIDTEMEYLSELLSGVNKSTSSSTERDWAEGNVCDVTFTGVNLPGVALRVDPIRFTAKELQYMAVQIKTLNDLADNTTDLCVTPDAINYGKQIEVKLNPHSLSFEQEDDFNRFDLSVINIDRPADKLVDQIQGVLSKPKDERPSLISALFYGVPGSGKSQLANYVGAKLGVPVIKKTYAELQSMYVAEGEKQLAQAFAEAQSANAILLIDELDSVAGNRSKADKNYQKTFVNQLLTELDNFKGIFIATCNFLDSLDPAVLRRLFLKIKFDFLDEDQIETCFKLYFPKLKRSKLGYMQYLTPGDFKAVQEACLFEIEKPNVKRVRELLTQEVSLKKKTLGEVIKAETKAGYEI